MNNKTRGIGLLKKMAHWDLKKKQKNGFKVVRRYQGKVLRCSSIKKKKIKTVKTPEFGAAKTELTALEVSFMTGKSETDFETRSYNSTKSRYKRLKQTKSRTIPYLRIRKAN